ncbi:MAG: acetyl-CoA carboxylase biotin carboxyl carrier protein [Deltaproteobacteria bacterium]|nr:acetyl-CoA carboxylase biotin carboxyl carrier protein [Deltaproteobacteria bacterium]
MKPNTTHKTAAPRRAVAGAKKSNSQPTPKAAPPRATPAAPPPALAKPAGPVPVPAVSSVTAGPDLAYVRALAEIVEEHGLSELRVKLGGSSLILRRGVGQAIVAAAVPMVAAPTLPVPAQVADGSAATPLPASTASPNPPGTPASSAATESTSNGQYVVVSSPFVGTFYTAPSPDAQSFIEVGQKVKKGQVLCIVEAMKLMNEIEAEIDGTVAACLVENAHPVEYGQPLFKLSPA